MRRLPSADLLLAAVLLSVAVHFALMFYARPRVMTSVASSRFRAGSRGPMKVQTEAVRPDPAKIASLDDSASVRPAPEVETPPAPPVASALPKAEGAGLPVPDFGDLPSATADGRPAVEVLEAPEFAASEATSRPAEAVRLPTVPSVALRPAGVPADALAAPAFPAAAGEDGGGLGMAVPAVPAESPRLTRDAAPEFKPQDTVMDKVDVKLVEAEKTAVRVLTDVPDAADLAQAVDLRLTTAREQDYVYFRLVMTERTPLPVVPKDVVVLIDASGSIGEARMKSIRQAAKRILRSAANTGDRFNLVAFRDRYSYAFDQWQENTTATFAAADRWLDAVAPFGRTDVFATIASVLTLPRDPKRPLIALVVTDGEANSGIRETSQILARFTALNDGLVSVYMYGVKTAANRELIDALTHGNRGESFVYDDPGLFYFTRTRAGEGIDGLAERFRDPVLSDLRLVFAATTPAEAFPRRLRNLYRGGRVEVTGRMPATARELAFSIKGLNGGKAYESFFRLPLARSVTDEKLPRDFAVERDLDGKLHQ